MNRFVPLFILLLLVMALAACGGGESTPADNQPVSAGDPAAGQKLFTSSCAACHGPEGQGVPGLGKDMTGSEFIASQSDEQLVAVIKAGIPPGQAPNDTAVAMPPKGGNPSLSDQDLYHIVAYLRTIKQ